MGAGRVEKELRWGRALALGGDSRWQEKKVPPEGCGRQGAGEGGGDSQF